MTWNDGAKPELIRFDSQFGRIAARIALPAAADASSANQAEGVAVTQDAVWVAFGLPKRLAKVDPRTNTITRTVKLPDGDVWGDTLLAAGDDQLWAIDRTGRRFVRVDPETGDVLASGKIHDGYVEDAAVVGGSLWLPVEDDAGVWQVNRTGAIVGKIETGQVPYALASAGTSLYVSNQNSGTVTRVDALTQETRQFDVGHRPLALGVTGSRLWVFVGQSAKDARARITGSRIVEAVTPGDPFFGTDPATLRDVEQHALQYAVGVRLMDVKVRADGSSEVYPSGAAAQPMVSNGGRTFTFRIRPGFRYSPPSNSQVTAADWKYSVERALSPVYGNRQTSYCQYVVGDIAGEAAYDARRARHISGITVAGTTIAFTLTKPSPTFPARLANACFTSVPLGTPALADGVPQPIASAGPYYVDSHIGGQQLILRPNPHYTGPRQRKLDALVFRNGVDPSKAASLVAEGATADYTLQSGNSDPAPSMTPGGLYERTLGASAGKPQIFPTRRIGPSRVAAQYHARAATGRASQARDRARREQDCHRRRRRWDPGRADDYTGRAWL